MLQCIAVYGILRPTFDLMTSKGMMKLEVMTAEITLHAADSPKDTCSFEQWACYVLRCVVVYVEVC